jgi:hypothetical protein
MDQVKCNEKTVFKKGEIFDDTFNLKQKMVDLEEDDAPIDVSGFASKFLNKKKPTPVLKPKAKLHSYTENNGMVHMKRKKMSSAIGEHQENKPTNLAYQAKRIKTD